MKLSSPRRVQANALRLVLIASCLAAFTTTWLGGFATAGSTRSFLIDSADDFARGTLSGTSVLSSGKVVPSLRLERVALPAAFGSAIVVGPDEQLFIGTGDAGAIYRVRGQDVEVFAETGALVVTSLLRTERGSLFAGTLPGGRIFRISPAGDVSLFAELEGTEHIWQLAYHEGRQQLFAATGPEGRLYAIDAEGNAAVLHDAEVEHLLALALEGDALFVGSGEDARVLRFRLTADPIDFDVVHDFEADEVTALDVRHGIVAAAVNEFPEPPRVTKTKGRPARPKHGKGALYRIGRDARTEVVYRTDESHIAAVEVGDDGVLYAGLGQGGRVVRVSPDLQHAVWFEVDERQVLGLHLDDTPAYFTTGDGAALYRALPPDGETAHWTSEVLDAQFHARFGQLSWRGTGGFAVQTRSGNSETPDETWSDWSRPILTPGPVRSPAARFVQIRVAMSPASSERRRSVARQSVSQARPTSSANPAPSLFAVQLFYLPQNQRPRVGDVRLKPPSKNESKNKGPRSQASESSSRYNLTWSTTNTDGDSLRYRLRYRAEGRSFWRSMFGEDEVLTETEYVWETEGIPDGWYVVEVEASDEPNNPASLTLKSRARSEPLRIDNHAPELSLRLEGNHTVVGQARDTLGPIARLEYAINAGNYNLFYPLDGLLDTDTEPFELDLRRLNLSIEEAVSLGSAEKISISIRVTDAGGNLRTEELEVPRWGALRNIQSCCNAAQQ